MEYISPKMCIVWSFMFCVYTVCGQVLHEDADGRLHLTYRSQEETPVPSVIGNIPSDVQLLQRKQLSSLEGIRYRILRQDSRFPDHFILSDTTGQLQMIQSINRDIPSCDGQLRHCDVSVDIGVTYVDRSFEAMFVTVMVSLTHPPTQNKNNIVLI